MDYLEQIPPSMRFGPQDAVVFERYREVMYPWRNEAAKAFYDTLFNFTTTAQVFRPGERSMREESLMVWWDRTIRGPFDQDYWDWMLKVSLVHLRRQVRNPMMQSMWHFLIGFVQAKALAELSPTQVTELMASWHRLGATCTALISEGYLESYLNALAVQTGLERNLMDKLAQQGILDLLERT